MNIFYDPFAFNVWLLTEITKPWNAGILYLCTLERLELDEELLVSPLSPNPEDADESQPHEPAG